MDLSIRAHTWWLPLRRCTVPESRAAKFCNYVQFGHATMSIFVLQLWVILFYNKQKKRLTTVGLVSFDFKRVFKL